MYFGLSEDQEFFQENIKKFLDDNASVDVIRKIATDHPELQKDIQKTQHLESTPDNDHYHICFSKPPHRLKSV